MAATWSISQMDDYIEHDGHDQVIFTLHWQCTDQTTVAPGETYNARVYSTQGLQPFGDLDPFTPWSEVTESQALDWLHDRMGAEAVSAVEAEVEAQLVAKVNPTTESGVPW